ncbi:glycoside hydrolase family 92 protein [Polychaeton citri CBS 116435]|uniref:Glycoside hydrolase family 92 protein n=1 Tax=Polychaeton citri CBS 116435 TaxID=1314669 RepID=A0A9P4QEE7_9PEZI|nr:glycoside hydrolase family 92 protein [Polychaeton citri CBS 116435]
MRMLVRHSPLKEPRGCTRDVTPASDTPPRGDLWDCLKSGALTGENKTKKFCCFALYILVILLLEKMYYNVKPAGLGFLLPVTVASLSFHENAGVLRYVNPRIGTYGLTPNGNGGMIPSTSPPFGMTRWTPQTRENYISQCPYNDMDKYIHGFQATHQPAIWMGESGQVVISPGIGNVQPLFTQRAHSFNKSDEVSTPYVYEVTMSAQSAIADLNLTESIYSPVPGGAGEPSDTVVEGANGRTRRAAPLERNEPALLPTYETISPSYDPIWQPQPGDSKIKTTMTASSHVGRLRFDFPTCSPHQWSRSPSWSGRYRRPYVFIQATRQNWTGHVKIDTEGQEISGSNSQRQDYALGPFKAGSFRGYFVSRFSEPFESFGVAHEGILEEGTNELDGTHIGAYARFRSGTKRVEVRTGVSFVSIEQARRNLDVEAPSGVTFDDAVENLKQVWLEKLGRVEIQGVNESSTDFDQRTIWYTGLFHALQYPSDFSEPTDNNSDGGKIFYSGYTDSVHTSNDSYYQSWSIWDTFRAEHTVLTLFAPERVNSMMRSLLQIYDWAGRLPMWANVVETNIMVGTHVDAVLANALERSFMGFNISKAWEAVRKNAYVPPINDTELLYYDREPDTPEEVRAGLTTYMSKGYVANDGWSESASRTLDYAFDDFAAAVVASHAGDEATSQALLERSKSYKRIYNTNTTFMEAKNANGTWAGSEQGWTEGDDWVYTFNVMHDPLGLAELMGGREKMKAKLDEYFAGGYNEHSNEPSHHSPYMYAAIGYPTYTQNLTRQIAADNYNATAAGLSGNEDLGQMSAWYLFTALGFYPVNPASDEYVVGAPFFEKVTIRLPAGAATGGVDGGEHTLTISAPNAPTQPFVKGLKVDGQSVQQPILTHRQLVTADLIEFEMSDQPRAWGSS